MKVMMKRLISKQLLVFVFLAVLSDYQSDFVTETWPPGHKFTFNKFAVQNKKLLKIMCCTHSVDTSHFGRAV